MGKLTKKEVHDILKEKGVRIYKTLFQEYRVFIPLPHDRQTEEDRAYYTDDLEDAMLTGLAMAKERDMREASHG